MNIELAQFVDVAGNLTVDPNGSQYTYDYENRIVKIEDSGDATVAEFAYDALGRRIKKVDSKANGGSGETTYYYYNDQWQDIEERDGLVVPVCAEQAKSLA